MIRISELTLADKPALRELFLRIRQHTFVWMDTTTFKLADFDDETKDEFVLVAHQGQHVAGFVSAWMPDHFIHHLYVDTPYQQHGIGTALLNALFLKANASFRLKCLQKNKAAIAFYKKKRFIEKERVTDIAGEYILFESTHS